MEIKSYDYLPQEAKYIREKVFVEEQGFENEFDDIDGFATHLVALDCGKPVATCRFFQKDDTQTYVLGRIAVLKEYRGLKVGARLIAEVEKALCGKAERILIHAQVRAQGFYEKQGYMPFGDKDEEENQPHVWMTKTIGKR